MTKLGSASPYEAVLIADSARVALQAAPLIHKGGATRRILGTELWNAEGALASNPP